MKTYEKVKEEQDRLKANGYYLGWWYGVSCKKCCGVYPKFMKKEGFDPKDCYYQCEVCGRRTAPEVMPWIARDAWNLGKTYFEDPQISLDLGSLA